MVIVENGLEALAKLLDRNVKIQVDQRIQELEALEEPRDRKVFVLIASSRRIINFSLKTVMEMGIARCGLPLPLNHQMVIVENLEVRIAFHMKQENLLDSDPVCFPSRLSHIGSRGLHIVNNLASSGPASGAARQRQGF